METDPSAATFGTPLLKDSQHHVSVYDAMFERRMRASDYAMSQASYTEEKQQRPSLQSHESRMLAGYIRDSNALDDDVDENTWWFELTANVRKVQRGNVQVRQLRRRSRALWLSICMP
jgi:hypothetical protein